MKNIAMLLVAGCAVGMLTGCGIKEEDHNRIIAELEAKHQGEVDKLKGEVADKDSIIKNEKANVRQSRIELDDATDRIKDLQQKSAETSSALATAKSKSAKFESELKTANSLVAAAQDTAQEAVKKYSTLEVEYKDLKNRFEMFQKNMNSMGTPSASTAPSAVSTKTAPASKEAPKVNKASSLLDQMGTL